MSKLDCKTETLASFIYDELRRYGYEIMPSHLSTRILQDEREVKEIIQRVVDRHILYTKE